MPLINPIPKLDEILERLSSIEKLIKNKLEIKKTTRKKKKIDGSVNE
ncbi:hypothetical protein M0R19_08545 [Candidatus Pacearchaeota archaeon]|nr:hypothetical protein [Candidatus Pacearchaeota archaeon]